MTIKELRKTIRTYKDWELREMRTIIGNEELTKHQIITMELKRREKPDYVDETLPETVSIRQRLKDSS